MTRKDCNWGSTLLRSMSIQFSFSACITAIRVPTKNRQDTRWESKWVIAGQRLSWGHICFGGSTFKHHSPDPLLWNSGKRFSSYLDPWLFLWLGYKSAKTQKVQKRYPVKSSPCISAKVSSAIYFHQIQPPWTVTVSEQYRPTTGGTIFPHTHTLSSLLSLFLDSRFWSLWWQFWLIVVSNYHLFGGIGPSGTNQNLEILITLALACQCMAINGQSSS